MSCFAWTPNLYIMIRIEKQRTIILWFPMEKQLFPRVSEVKCCYLTCSLTLLKETLQCSSLTGLGQKPTMSRHHQTFPVKQWSHTQWPTVLWWLKLVVSSLFLAIFSGCYHIFAWCKISFDEPHISIEFRPWWQHLLETTAHWAVVWAVHTAVTVFCVIGSKLYWQIKEDTDILGAREIGSYSVTCYIHLYG